MHATVIVIDFDDVASDYSAAGGWQGEGFDVIRGEPAPGFREALETIRNKWCCLVFIHSSRIGFDGGIAAIVSWCKKYNIQVDGICLHKIPADVYIDDKGLHHAGDWKDTLDQLQKRLEIE